MNNNNSLSHTTWNCTYHIVFAPKYRRKVAYGKLREDIRNQLQEDLEYDQMTIKEYVDPLTGEPAKRPYRPQSKPPAKPVIVIYIKCDKIYYNS